MNVSNPEDIFQFRAILLAWAKNNKRSYPWRESKYRTPYATAMAELMLRRTKADQVVPVYLAFMEAYPDLKSAADAPEESLKRMLYPLGLAWRATSVVAFLQEAWKQFGNDLPAEKSSLLKLPGIGDYVGSAIQCFAGDGNAVLIDVNVVRVLGRIFGLDISGEARRRRDMRSLATIAFDKDHPAEYHYAILDFGAKICHATKPDCLRCPYQKDNSCCYFASVKSAELSKS